jgi:ABC-type oligopeptide transport system ATPase subunit
MIEEIPQANMPLLEIADLHLAMPDRAATSAFGRTPLVEILKGVSFSLERGESLAVVGESGSGKTSLGRALLRLYEPTAGKIVFEGKDITHLPESALASYRGRAQMIFQDPQSALNPRHRIEQILARPLLAYGYAANAKAAREEVGNLLHRVGLPRAFAARYPHELSGGQRQRVGIARAIAVRPSLIVADEIVSGLDVSTQAQILLLLRQLKEQDSLIFISHDLSVVRALCDRVLVIRAGEIVEQGSCAQVFGEPQHPYTRALLDAIPLPEVEPHWLEEVSEQPYTANSIIL